MNRATSRTPFGTQEDRVRRRRALGQAIRDYRRDMPQADLGTLLDVPQTTISRWERGLVDLTLEHIHDLEVVLKVAPGTLMIASGYARLNVDDMDPVLAVQHSRRIAPELKDVAIATIRGWEEVSERMATAGNAKRRTAAHR